MRGKETSMCGCLLYAPYWEPGPRNPGTCPDWESNQLPLVRRQVLNSLSHSSQGEILIILKQNTVYLIHFFLETYV